MAMKILVGVALLYVAVCAWFYVNQASLVFRPDRIEGRHVVPGETERRVLQVDGITLAGVRFEGQRQGPVLLSFSGNAEDNIRFSDDLRQWSGLTTFGYNYRGYGESQGQPTQENSFADALRVFDAVQAEADGRGVVLVGYSLGSSVAAYVAAQRQTAGVILVTPFESLGAVAQGHYPFLPVEFMLKHDFNTLEFIGQVEEPVVIVRAEDDRTVPAVHTARLKEAVPQLRAELLLPNANHAVSYNPDFVTALNEALRVLKQ